MKIRKCFITFTLIVSCFALTCHGAMWKLDDGTVVIDDLPDDELDMGVTEPSTICTDSNGDQGRCVPREECNPFYNFIEGTTENRYNQLEILEGLWKYINSTSESEPCQATTPIDEVKTTPSTKANYVCCTSVRYANTRRVSLEEYLDNDPSEPAENVTELLPAVANPLKPLVPQGTPARIGEFPYAVAILFNGKQFCGGSLLGSQWVLCAAHCFDKFDTQKARQLVIRAGDLDIHSPNDVMHQDSRVSKLFLHPGFFRAKNYFRDDVAVIKLKTPIQSSANVRSISMHTGNPDINTNSVQATVCGWGKTCAANSCPTSSVLRKAKLTVLRNAQCNNQYTGTGSPPITDGMVCATGEGGQDSCQGDSGGPLVIYHNGQTLQVGIVSWGVGCGQLPGVYTRVSSYFSWVNKYMRSV